MNLEKGYKTALLLEYFTVIYNVLEAAVSMFFGLAAGSVALVGFGLDSIVESLSGSVLIWRLRKHGKVTEEEEERIEKRAMKFVAVTFFILAVYILFESIKKLVTGEEPEPSIVGIIIAITSIIIMPILAWRKKVVGKAIGSKALIEDAKETLVCSVLSVALLLGLALNYLWGFWQADPIVGLFIFIFLVKEGIETWKEANEED